MAEDRIDVRKFGRDFGPVDGKKVRLGLDPEAVVSELRAFCDRIEAGRVNVEKVQYMQEAEGSEWHTQALYIEFEEMEPADQEHRAPDPIIKLS